MHSSPVYVTTNMINMGVVSVMEICRYPELDGRNIQMEAEDADRTEI